MAIYLRRVETLASLQVWRIEPEFAVQLGVPNAEESPGCYVRAEPGESILDAIARKTPWKPAEFEEAELEPGQYYPRMARPVAQVPHESPGWSPAAKDESNAVAMARGQLTALARQLGSICQTIHPDPSTFAAYGHDIRNLLILACTEVETHWRGILVANGITKDRLSTREYVELCDAMKLDAYAVAFSTYPWLDPINPFEGWGQSGKPTQELRWYDSYNAVKHDRESKFQQATLRHAFEAVSACAVLMAAQFGIAAGFGQRTSLSTFFQLATVPTWPIPKLYIIHHVGAERHWSPTPYPFKFNRP